MLGLLLAVMTVTLIALIVGIVLYIRRINQAVFDISETLAEMRKQVFPLAEDVKRVLANTDGLVFSTQATVESIGRVAESVERLADGTTLTGAATKVVASSRSTLNTVLDGVREALKAFRNAKVGSEEPEAPEAPPEVGMVDESEE